MNRTLVQFVLRHTDTDGGDPDLLRRFVASGDEPAFAALVQRHGPMVWAACRHLVPNRADAEDAFQAVFLALARSARSIRDPERLASWLHGAAVRIAGKAKRAFLRRTAHERRTAKPDGEVPVAAGAWGDMLSAVHDEVAKLPPSLRAAFVLCDLEGVDPSDAAARLGVKVNTLSGQLARARQRLLDSLTTRGLGVGLATIGTAVAVPHALAARAAQVLGTAPPGSVLELATEVMTMKLTKLKLLAAMLMATCGLTLTGFGLWPRADAQPPSGVGGPAVGRPPGASDLGGPATGGPAGGGLFAPGGAAAGSADGSGPAVGGPTRPRAAFEYLFVAKPTRRGALADIADLLRTKAEQGWEYTGPLDVDRDETPRGKEFEGITMETRVVLVFKRATRPAGGTGAGVGSGAGASLGTPGGAGAGPNGAPARPESGGLFGGGGGPQGKDVGIAALIDPLFKRLDKNGDGQLTPDEMPKGLKDTFRLYDANNDGLISRAEFAAYLPVALGADPGAIPGVAGPVAGGDGREPGQPAEVHRVLRLKNAAAEDAVRTLGEVFNGPKANQGASRVRLVADARSNSIIVIQATAADLLVMEELLHRAIDAEPAERRK